MMRWIDIPPVWLALFAILAWLLSGIGPRLDSPVLQFAGGLMVGGGLLLMLLAVVAMNRARTTVIPHREPSSLVTTGVFRLSRNPIYLGDALILTGLILRWGAIVPLALVPLFIWLVTDRFILPEEARLRRGFGPAFELWARKTRRWV